MNQKVHLGYDALSALDAVLSGFSAKKIFLVTGRRSYQTSGAAAALAPALSSRQVVSFNDFGGYPRVEDVERGIAAFKDGGFDAIVAVGGGSVIDIAKLVNIFSSNPGSPRDYIHGRKKIENSGRPLVAIPTTAGAGSEATRFAVIYDDKIKYSFEHDDVLPTVALVDPTLSLSMDHHTAASSGIDALAQAIESYWSVRSTETSQKHAREAIDLITTNLEPAVNHPDRDNKLAMSHAAHLAGCAIDITRTTAPHAISYPMTAHFGVSHGHAVGLTLGEIYLYNAQADDRHVGKTFHELNAMLGVGDERQARDKIKNLMKKIGLATSLEGVKIKPEDLGVILKNVDPVRLQNNPRGLSERALKEILIAVLN